MSPVVSFERSTIAASVVGCVGPARTLTQRARGDGFGRDPMHRATSRFGTCASRCWHRAAGPSWRPSWTTASRWPWWWWTGPPRPRGWPRPHGVDAVLVERTSFGADFDRDAYTEQVVDVLAARTTSSSWSWPASAPSSARRSTQAFPDRILNTHPALLPVVQGLARRAGRPRLRREGHRLHRPRRHPRGRRRPDPRPGGRRRCCPTTTRRRSTSASRPSSAGSTPTPSGRSSPTRRSSTRNEVTNA